MITIPNIKRATNLDLATVALNSLKELVRRGNEELNEARREVAFFHSNILCLQSMISAIGHGLDDERELDYEDRLALDD